jgi:hypothetical protein
MQIVPQSASLSYFQIQPRKNLLAAPPARLMLPAPRIAGLLPATIQGSSATPRVEVICNKPRSLEEVLREIGPLRTLEEVDAEINGMLQQIKDNMSRLREELNAEKRARAKERWG